MPEGQDRNDGWIERLHVVRHLHDRLRRIILISGVRGGHLAMQEPRSCRANFSDVPARFAEALHHRSRFSGALHIEQPLRAWFLPASSTKAWRALRPRLRSDSAEPSREITGTKVAVVAAKLLKELESKKAGDDN